MVQKRRFIRIAHLRLRLPVGFRAGSTRTGLFSLSAAAIALAATPAAAQDRCSAFVGKTVAPESIDTVVALAEKVPSSKGEFETTAAFQARHDFAVRNLPPEIIVSIPLDPKYLTYDADKGSMSVSAYAIDNRNTGYEGAFGPDSPHPEVKTSPLNNLDLLVSETETPVGTYQASNAYGANAMVTRIERRQKAIFERALEPNEATFTNQLSDTHLLDLAMSPDEARRFKLTGRAAAVIAPKPPFFANAKKHWSPRFDRPTDISQSVQVVVADIQCVLLTDAANRVLGGISVR